MIAAGLLFAALWFFPLVARFQNTVCGHWKQSFLFAFEQFPKTLLAFFVWALFLGAPVAFFAVFFYFGWFGLLFGLSLPMLITASLFLKPLQLLPAADEQAE